MPKQLKYVIFCVCVLLMLAVTLVLRKQRMPEPVKDTGGQDELLSIHFTEDYPDKILEINQAGEMIFYRDGLVIGEFPRAEKSKINRSDGV